MLVFPTEYEDIRVWMSSREELEDTCLDEAKLVASQPYIDGYVTLMPDCHASGYNMPIGTVVKSKGIISPELVSKDIGCGVAFRLTDIPAKTMEIDTPNGKLKQKIVGDIMREIPTGFEHRDPDSDFSDIEELKELNYKHTDYIEYSTMEEKTKLKLRKILDESYEIIGTLGGGNHFLEVQENNENKLGIMVHCGSRSIGAKVYKHFSKLAKIKNKKWRINDLFDNKLIPYLPVSSKEGKHYMKFMNYARKVAKLNRKIIMEIVTDIVFSNIEKYSSIKPELKFKYNIDADHNHAEYENINDTNYIVHRKGAVRARESDIVPIPGAMGSNSYICKGKGNVISYRSASHGAGRTHTRTDALNEFSTQEVIEDFKKKVIAFGKRNKEDAAEEYYKAYKDIDKVMDNQKDLVGILEKLKTIAVVKG